MKPEAIAAEIELGRELVPDHLWPGLCRYLVERIRPGQFLCAVLENNLHDALTRADDIAVQHLRGLVVFLDIFAPGPCHGSPEAVAAWLAKPEVDS